MSGRKRMLSPREHIALVLQMRAAADTLEAMTPIQCCLNCANLIYDGERRVCGKVLQEIPATYAGQDCKVWSEEIPF